MPLRAAKRPQPDKGMLGRGTSHLLPSARRIYRALRENLASPAWFPDQRRQQARRPSGLKPGKETLSVLIATSLILAHPFKFSFYFGCLLTLALQFKK